MPQSQKASKPREYPSDWEMNQVERFNLVLNRNHSDLLRESSTEFNFLEIKSLVESVIRQVEKLSENYDFWQQLSESRRVNLNQSIDDMIKQFDSMIHFDPKQNGAWDLRNTVVSNFKSYYNNFYEYVVTPLNAYLGSRAFSEELSSEFGKKAQNELAEISRVKKEIETIQRDVSQAAQVAGSTASAAQSVSFEKQANEHSDAARNWLATLIVGGIISSIIIIIVVADFIQAMTNKNFTENLEGYILKAAVLALLFFAIRFIIRNYSANRHLYIINKHRANTLASILAFRDSAVSDAAKDTILLAGVSSAYSHQETGFLTTKEGAGSENNDITEIVQSIRR